MKRLTVVLIGLALPLALAACKEGEKPKQDARAAGEILPGSASDAMIPYDTLRSQPPLAPKPVASGKPGAAEGDAEGDEAAATEAATPDDAPAVSVPPVTPSGE
jgi:hypothetical protein